DGVKGVPRRCCGRSTSRSSRTCNPVLNPYSSLSPPPPSPHLLALPTSFHPPLPCTRARGAAAAVPVILVWPLQIPYPPLPTPPPRPPTLPPLPCTFARRPVYQKCCGHSTSRRQRWHTE
ncbi:unnamed protein product, partial [Closterium sp. NIES-53]